MKSSSVTVKRMRLASPWNAEAAFKKKAAE